MKSTSRQPFRIVILTLLFLPAMLHAQSEFRAIHLSPGAPAVDIYIGDATTPTVTNLGFGGASHAVQIPAGMNHIKVTPAGMPSLPVIDADVNVAANSRSSILALNTVTAIEASTVALDLGTTVDPDSARVRLIHASHDLGMIDVKIIDASGIPHMLDAVAFKSQSPFIDMPKGDVTIEVRQAGTQNLLYSASTMLDGGTTATIFASGPAASFALRLLNESDASAQNPMQVLGPQVDPSFTFIRAVHLVTDAPAVDVYAGGNLILPGIAFRDASSLARVDSGSYTLGVTMAGQPLGTAVINTNLALHEDSAYTIVALGTLASPPSITILSRPLDLAIPNDSALVRLVHASHNAGPLNLRITDAGGKVHTLTNASFKTVGDYMTLPQGSFEITASIPGGGSMRTAVGVLSGGEAFTIFANGDVTAQAFEFHGLIDTDTSRQAPMFLLGMQRGAVRAVHLIPDLSAVDIHLDNNGSSPLQVGFRDASPTSDDFAAGMLSVKVSPPGGGIGGAVIDASVQVKPDTLQTIFAVGSLAAGNAGVVVLPTGDADFPPGGSTAVRFLHASPDAGAVDVDVTYSNASTITIQNVPFKDHRLYSVVPAGTTTVKISPAGSQTPLLTVRGDLPADAIVTAILSGSVAGGSLGVNLLIESEDAPQRPMILLAPISSVAEDRSAATIGLLVQPNPVRKSGTLSYILEEPGMIDLTLYNSIGELVAATEGKLREAGSHSISLPVEQLPAGIYTAILNRNGVRIGTARLVVTQ